LIAARDLNVAVTCTNILPDELRQTLFSQVYARVPYSDFQRLTSDHDQPVGRCRLSARNHCLALTFPLITFRKRFRKIAAWIHTARLVYSLGFRQRVT
jgi:hypothetical protein